MTHPQLNDLEEQFRRALLRLRGLAADFGDDAWHTRPAAGGWSAAECVAHLNLTSASYLPLLDDALSRAKGVSAPVPEHFHRDLLGWIIWRSTRPEARMKVKTAPAFVPSGNTPTAPLVHEFERLQHGLVARLQKTEGLPIQRIKVASPFNDRVRYSLYSAFTILTAHEHRHLNQAERALRG
jgi:hypothetical protein